MVEKENDDFLIDIEKSDDETRIRITGVKINKFDQAYRLASHLNLKAKELDVEIEEERKITSMKMQVSHLWTRVDSNWQLDKLISNPSYRIALSLLRKHPQCKKQVDVINETGVAKMTVSDNLGWKVKSTQKYFDKCKNGHRLSIDGLRWVSDKIIPLLSSSSNITQDEGGQ